MSNRTKFTSNRRYPTVPTVTADVRSHTLALQALIEGVNIGQRRAGDVLDSFVRLGELVDIGLIEVNGTTLQLSNWGDGIDEAPTDGSQYARQDGEWTVVTIPAATAETDPVFTAHVAYTILSGDITNWNTAYGWGNHASAGYLTVEADPVFTGHVAYGILAGDITNWNTAYGWGNHASAGYLTTVVAADVNAEASTVGYVLTSDGAGNATWQAVSPAGTIYLDDIADVSVYLPTDGYILTWDSGSGLWVAAAPTSGVTDHGALTGLSDDDHPQYAKNAGGTYDVSYEEHTGYHYFTGEARFFYTEVYSAASAAQTWYYCGVPAADNRWWTFEVNTSGVFAIGTSNDAGNTFRDALSFARSGVGVTSVTYGNSTDLPIHYFWGQVALQTDGFITFDEHASAPATPSAGRVAIYAKADGKVYIKDDGGTETDLTATGAAGSGYPRALGYAGV